MFFDFLSIFSIECVQYLFFGLGILGLFICLKRLIMGRG